MKKLTKRVQAVGLWFDVPLGATHIAADETGNVFAYTGEPTKKGYFWDSETSSATDICYIDLEGADWRNCCWYIGDQVGGEAAERREWMARGVEEAITNAFDTVPPTRLQMTSRLCAYAAKIRAGEIE